jgi:uncharacterized protein YqjF (DUF2071 family)
LYRLQRHPFPVEAHFEHCLVLAYAFPEAALRGLLPPGLALDTHDGHGFVAAAFVQARRLRPAFFPPACGRDLFLAGYRVFATHRTPEGRTLRGLRILRSDADRRTMVWAGNLLTHYNYHFCHASVTHTDGELVIRVRTPRAEADVDLTAYLNETGLPAGSPFADERAARRFEGPLPYTFDLEARTGSIIRIKAVRDHWSPRLVRVEVRELGFLKIGPLAGLSPVMASAFHVAQIPYRWERGVAARITGAVA